MSAAQVLLLAGVFGPPLLLLGTGHAYRRRSRTTRGTFWGAVAGYSVGLVLAAVAMLVPAVDWAGSSLLRESVVHAGPLAGFLLGTGVGRALAIGRREKSHL